MTIIDIALLLIVAIIGWGIVASVIGAAKELVDFGIRFSKHTQQLIHSS